MESLDLTDLMTAEPHGSRGFATIRQGGRNILPPHRAILPRNGGLTDMKAIIETTMTDTPRYCVITAPGHFGANKSYVHSTHATLDAAVRKARPARGWCVVSAYAAKGSNIWGDTIGQGRAHPILWPMAQYANADADRLG